MNEERITEYLVEFIESVNDITTPAFEAYRTMFITENFDIIRKYVPLTKRLHINLRNFISQNLFLFNGEFLKKEIRFSYTRIRLGQNKTLVPIEFNCLMESILTKNLNESGLFRRSATLNDLENCQKIFKDTKLKIMFRLDIINHLLQFDLITLTSVYKQLFDNYAMPLIPNRYLKLLLTISRLDSDYEKIVLLKYIIYTMPKPNRNMLDSVCSFFSLIQFLIACPKQADSRNMDMHGFAVVIMPKIFLKPSTKVSLDDINNLIKVMEYIFENRMVIFSIGVEEYKDNDAMVINYYDAGEIPKIVHRNEIELDDEKEDDEY